MNRRTFLRGVAAAVPAGAVINDASSELDGPKMTAEQEDAYLIGRYMMLTPAQRLAYRDKLREEGLHELASGFARIA